MRTETIQECWEKRRELNAMVKNIERRVGSYNFYRTISIRDPQQWANHKKLIPKIQQYEIMVCNMTEYQFEIFKDLGFDVSFHKGNISAKTRKLKGFKRLK